MMECSICGRNYREEDIYNAISFWKVVKACESCISKEKMILLKKPTLDQIKESKEIAPYYKKVGDKRGSNLVRDKTRITSKEFIDEGHKEQKKQKILQIEKTTAKNLVDNFHWILMRARRMKKITQEQLAQQIGESESVIKKLEQGILPENYYVIIKKLEAFLRVNVIKNENQMETPSDMPRDILIPSEDKETIKPQPARILKFDQQTLNSLKISDLRKMKEAKEQLEKDQIDLSNETINYQENSENFGVEEYNHK
ncbi:MAG: helix-turn-helix domain-containing protein [Candidatus Pacearchaeota archaeon]